MPNKFDKSGMIHQWIYVIVPVDKDLVFSAFCKICRSYFSEKVPYNGVSGRVSPSSLPKYGCDLPDDVPVSPI